MAIVRSALRQIDRTVSWSILGGLAILAAVAWLLTIWQAQAMGTLMNAGVPMSLEMGGSLGLSSAVLFLLIWMVMMAAMMFPSVWPVVLIYAAVIRTRGRGSVPLFVAGYLLAWEALGILAYAGYIWAGVALASASAERVALLTGAVVIAAGLYQFTPLKRACLAHCQGPIEFLAAHWRPGPWGALRMGVSHGTYCLGCCWGLMLALFALGVMDLRWMATVSAAIALEKLGPRHRLVPAAVGIGLVLLGIVIAFWPRPGVA
jgi:predicted metal-binding membrane protein